MLITAQGYYNELRCKYHRAMQNLITRLTQAVTVDYMRHRCYRIMQNLVTTLLYRMKNKRVQNTHVYRGAARHQTN